LNHTDQGERLRAVLEIAPTGPQAAVPRTPKSVFRRLEPNKVAQLVQGYVGGLRVDELASHFQVNKSTVIGHLDRAGVARRWRKLQPADVQEANLYASGLSLANVAGRFGRPRQHGPLRPAQGCRADARYSGVRALALLVCSATVVARRLFPTSRSVVA
jgi:hypothetical protein